VAKRPSHPRQPRVLRIVLRQPGFRTHQLLQVELVEKQRQFLFLQQPFHQQLLLLLGSLSKEIYIFRLVFILFLYMFESEELLRGLFFSRQLYLLTLLFRHINTTFQFKFTIHSSSLCLFRMCNIYTLFVSLIPIVCLNNIN
jgi:hypothetical protein